MADGRPPLVFSGVGHAGSGDIVNWLNGAWALLNIVLFHAASNIWSDYFDYKHKVDTEESFGVKILTSGQFAPKEIFWGALLLLGVACLAGAGLWMRTGMPLLYIGSDWRAPCCIPT